MATMLGTQLGPLVKISVCLLQGPLDFEVEIQCVGIWVVDHAPLPTA